MLEIVGGTRLVSGKIVDIERTTAGGFVTGGVIIEKLNKAGTEAQPKDVYVHFQWLVAKLFTCTNTCVKNTTSHLPGSNFPSLV